MKTIYGVFHKEKCLYVGQTIDLSKRTEAHKYAGRFPAKVKVKTLRLASKKNAHRIEGQVIRAFKKRGQANLNTCLNKKQDSSGMHNIKITDEAHKAMHRHCKKFGINMTFFASQAIIEKDRRDSTKK